MNEARARQGMGGWTDGTVCKHVRQGDAEAARTGGRRERPQVISKRRMRCLFGRRNEVGWVMRLLEGGKGGGPNAYLLDAEVSSLVRSAERAVRWSHDEPKSCTVFWSVCLLVNADAKSRGVRVFQNRVRHGHHETPVLGTPYHCRIHRRRPWGCVVQVQVQYASPLHCSGRGPHQRAHQRAHPFCPSPTPRWPGIFPVLPEQSTTLLGLL